jgi:hypothetical protein
MSPLKLLPPPRQVRYFSRTLLVRHGLVLQCAADLPAAERAALERFRKQCSARGVRCGEAAKGAPGVCPLRIRVDAAAGGARSSADQAGPRAQGYTLRIVPDAVELVGRTAAGVTHGLQTLAQILQLCGDVWPCVEIVDEPDFAVRGVSYDISRGRVPTLVTLQRLVDRLVLLKVNQLQLYTEHTFAFAFDPDISAGCTPLTADEIRELDTYCAARRIELVPSLASFGHMARILSLPRYRHLAEISVERGWERLTWRQRVRGLTLDATNPEARKLLAAMYAEYLPLFSSGQVNVSCDETFDLAKGRGQARANEVGAGRLFLEHLLWLHGLCAQAGKRIQFWGDVVKHYPEILPEVPRDATVLNWAYGANDDYEGTGLFRAAGLETMVCPGSSAWNRFVPDLVNAEANIRRFAEAGQRHGATGLLNTDWGDEGHVCPPSCSWHALALGAAVAWNGATPTGAEFDAAYAELMLGAGGAEAVAAWRAAIAVSDMVRVWPAFFAPLAIPPPLPVGSAAPTEALFAETPVAGPPLAPELEALARFDEVGLRRWEETALAAAEAAGRITAVDDEAARDRDELALALRLHALAGQRLQLGKRLAAEGTADAALRAELRELARACEDVVEPYEAAWRARHKEAELREVVAVLRRIAREAREAGA